MSPDPEPPDFSPPPVPPVEAAVAADQIAAHATEVPVTDGHHRPLHTHCENCGTELQGPYCHKCGQHDFDVHRSFGHAVHDALENFFHFDAKLFRNTVTLLFRPGVLSTEFNAGHRAAQMPPLRFYIFISILFFFVSFAGRHDTAFDAALPYTAIAEVRTDLAEATAELEADPGDPKKVAKVHAFQTMLRELQAEVGVTPPAPTPASPPTPATSDAPSATLDPGAESAAPPAAKPRRPAEPQSELERTLAEKMGYALGHQREIGEAFLHAIPKILLVCLPFFALYTRFLFRKSGQVYLQHLVVAVHYHTFIFLWLMFRSGWGGIADLFSHTLHNWIVLACNAWLVLYPLLMLRRLFGNSWKRTIAKTFVLAMAYLFTLAGVFVATAAIIFLTL